MFGGTSSPLMQLQQIIHMILIFKIGGHVLLYIKMSVVIQTYQM